MVHPIQSKFSENKTCITCKNSIEDKQGLKIYLSKFSVRNAEEKMCSLICDKFEIATKDMLSFEISREM